MCWSVVSIECGLAKFALRVVASPKSCWFKPVTRRNTVVLEKMLTRRASVTTPTTTERGRVRRTSNHVPSKPRRSSARRPTGGPSHSSAPHLPRPRCGVVRCERRHTRTRGGVGCSGEGAGNRRHQTRGLLHRSPPHRPQSRCRDAACVPHRSDEYLGSPIDPETETRPRPVALARARG